jgi:hypothetical protein
VSIGSIGEKGRMELKLCCSGNAGASAGIKYRHGVALVSFFSLDMWAPLWVVGVGSVLHVGLILPQPPAVVLLTTFNIYNFYTHNGDDIP